MHKRESYEPYIAYGIFGWIDIWFSNGMKETPEELNRIIV
ncbi:MAG: TetR family transcriptional regulator C-terminal domain-containing protein [Solobacterium sp.]|nr:TetR family transcriptional regulator C-terminal domain-containing protein [Solobacterium sp.]